MLPALLMSILAFLFASDLPANKDVHPVKIAEVQSYCEGIVFDRDGKAYISEMKSGTIFMVTSKGETKVWAKTGKPNGHKILADGTHLVCDGEQKAVLHLNAKGKVIGKASSECNGKPLREPNDLTLDPNGGFYFTDPGGSSVKKPIGTVHYVDPQGKTHLVAEGLAFPNGILLRPDGKRLLVAESGYNRILAFDVISPGKVGYPKVFADLPAKQGDQIANSPDGMCFDDEGNLYVAHYGMGLVQVLNPLGDLLRSYPAGNLTASNVAFGGPNMDQLYVTGALSDEESSKGALFRLDLKGVRGLSLLPK